jgi:hypothetical protein
MLDAGHSAHSIVSTTDIHVSRISKLHFKRFLSLSSLQMVIYLNFPLAKSDMLFTLSLFERQKMIFRPPKPLATSLASLSQLVQFSII